MEFDIDNLKEIYTYCIDDELDHYEEWEDVELPLEIDSAMQKIEELKGTNTMLYKLLILGKNLGFTKI